MTWNQSAWAILLA